MTALGPGRHGNDSLSGMTNAVAPVEEPPVGHARIVYLGPVSPHWEVYADWGERTDLDEFRARTLARLVLLPRDDPSSGATGNASSATPSASASRSSGSSADGEADEGG